MPADGAHGRHEFRRRLYPHLPRRLERATAVRS